MSLPAAPVSTALDALAAFDLTMSVDAPEGYSVQRAGGEVLSACGSVEAARVALRTHLLEDGEPGPLFAFHGSAEWPLLVAVLLAGEVLYIDAWGRGGWER